MADQTDPGVGAEESRESGANAEGGQDSPYRGASSDYDREIYPRSYRVPGRINLNKAMREYVEGHDRGWDQETKSRRAEQSLERDQSRKGYLGPGQALASGEQAETVAGEATASEAADVSADELQTRFGVGVPYKLEFHRGADTWRDRLEELIHGAVEEAPDDEPG